MFIDQVNGIVSGYLDDLTADLVVGDNLTTATQLGEQHEAFTRKCMEVCACHMLYTHVHVLHKSYMFVHICVHVGMFICVCLYL